MIDDKDKDPPLPIKRGGWRKKLIKPKKLTLDTTFDHENGVEIDRGSGYVVKRLPAALPGNIGDRRF